jgi:hypothetical protein
MECSRIKINGKPCEREAFVGGLCLFHDSLAKAKKRKRLAAEAWYQILESLWTFRDEETAEGTLNDTLPHLKPKEAVTFRWKYAAELYRYAQDTKPLCVLADNSQNVHTLPVNTQTEQTLALLRTLERPVGRNVPNEILDAWMEHDRVPGDRMVTAGQDVFAWYPFCTELIDLLWVFIQTSPHTDELVLRLYQEVRESHGKCLSGFIARLCNVLVGFT